MIRNLVRMKTYINTELNILAPHRALNHFSYFYVLEEMMLKAMEAMVKIILSRWSWCWHWSKVIYRLAEGQTSWKWVREILKLGSGWISRYASYYFLNTTTDVTINLDTLQKGSFLFTFCLERLKTLPAPCMHKCAADSHSGPPRAPLVFTNMIGPIFTESIVKYKITIIATRSPWMVPISKIMLYDIHWRWKKIKNKRESKTWVKGLTSNNKRTYNHMPGVYLNKKSNLRCWSTFPIQKKRRWPPLPANLIKKNL